MIGIYKIENLLNHKIYIGQSCNIERRWKDHIRRIYNSENDNLPLYKAFRKYGKENFSFEIIELCSIEDLDIKEKRYIKQFNSLVPNGYNVAMGGQSSTTHTLNYEQVKEIKDLLKNSSLSQEEISKKFEISQQSISDINLGKSWAEEEESYPIRKHKCIQNVIIEERKCPICGTKMISKGLKCLECFNLSRRKTERPSREELKKMIRFMPFTTIAKQYNVSDNAIRKWCKSYNLPSKKKEISNYSEEEWSLL